MATALAPAQFAPASYPGVSTLALAPIPQVDAQRKQEQAHAWKAYQGQLQRPLVVERDQPDDNVLSNRCGPVVDKGVSFLFGQVLKLEATQEKTDAPADGSLPSDAAAAPTPVQDFLDGLWGDDDDRMTLLSKMAVNGGVFGHVFLKLIPAKG